MRRLKRLLNKSEAATREPLGVVARHHGAEVFAKTRVADVLPIDGSGISDELFAHALRAHFDFIVADAHHEPLFAVEFDGPRHGTDERAQAGDLKKNSLCRHFGLPLARVRDEHVFQQARGIGFVTWLAELFFSSQVLSEAAARGELPPGSGDDPMNFVTHEHLPGGFPLFISSAARCKVIEAHARGELRTSTPTLFCGEDAGENTTCLAVLSMASDHHLVARSSIYLHGFGVLPRTAAEEVAVVCLLRRLKRFRSTGSGTLATEQLRELVVWFLENYDSPRRYGSTHDLGFLVPPVPRA